ncbi:MAP kinase [Suhomyces tanzawaensis NRRL Y-17324]|uniref:MAP kinase kinase kinase n=1 Tax=Suhomyces tanzawaensis NRRL Y-17324 TaxID=984487 RepID=A0A1E4SHS4_9ASCO|nr:MAP kinase [Suhomyces tanzawaensis NRRL Y-17324]ODV79030.1 MAP kinase [Suhomyces tanzawaensis NRRL Y-17324]
MPSNVNSANASSSSHTSPASTSTTSTSGVPSSGGRSRSRSLIQTLTHNLQHHNNSQYLAQEKAYLRKLKNQLVDDYYTKGITGADTNLIETNDHDDDDDDLASNGGGNTDLLADIDDDKYQIDFGLAFSMMKSASDPKFNLNPNKNITQLSKNDTDDPAVIERLEWQSMLTSVLTGDVVRSEKTKIINNNNPENGQESFLHATYKENLWFGVRAKIFNRTEEDQRRIISYRRTLVDQLIEDILKFEINYDDENDSPREQVGKILDQYDRACALWRTLDEMKNDKPLIRSEEFENRLDALIAWYSITGAIANETKTLKVWIGNDELDITKSSSINSSNSSSAASTPPASTTPSSSKVKKLFDEDNKSLAEKLMKEKGVHDIFRKRIFTPIAPWMVKSKDTYIRLGHMFETMKLPDYIHDLIHICLVPMKLIKEIIKVRLGYAMKLQKPTLMMIDQMIDDFKTYITIALEVKLGIQEYSKPDSRKTWILGDLFENEIQDFDQVVVECVKYFLILLNRKLLDSSRSPTNFRTFKEPEELEEAWKDLKWLGNFIEGGSVVVAEQITLLASRLIQRLLAYFNNQINFPQIQSSSTSDLIRWYSSTTENFGQLRRKLARFTGEISRDFTNSLVFDLSMSNTKWKNLLEILKATNHFLVYTGTVENQGTYFFASTELMGHEQEILKILTGSYIGQDPNEAQTKFSGLLKLLNMESIIPDNVDDQDASYFSYILALCPPKPIVWEGNVVTIHIDEVPITDVKIGQMLLITKLPYYSLHIVREKFLNLIGDIITGGGILKPVEQRCSLAKVHIELTKINRNFFKMSLSVFDSVKIARNKCKELAPEGGYQGLINSFFIYARDFGKNSIRNLDSSRKSTVIMKLIQLSIEWVSFICDDCIPTDRKTFRWCVLALEFSMDMTRGFNVLVLSDDQFHKLKLKVARCMSLLISHFDIMGARSSEAERNKLLKWTSQRHKIENSADDEYILKVYREDTMKQINEIEEYRRELQEELQSVGRVLDVSDLEYQFVTLLASSFSSVSIRWQKGRFIGGGTFGHVFAAVNLDTGGVMAVKEIRFHDSQSIKNIVPSIKDEMTVLEMLNHPNIVQYFGVEVHRDKVYIFMEFCEGGSLSGLLTHGRIEDEMVIQVYTLQMVEGLAYLHQSGVVHRDIKPENILLDHNGVIKFVDFGAAKVIATSGRTRAPGVNSVTSSRPANGTNRNNLNSMTGTPMYMSPEVITGTSTDRSGVVDIWSLGCCVLEMATGRRPWANLDNEWAIMYHIAAGHKPQLPSPDQLSEAGRKFLARCLEHDPKKRPSAAELLNDPWLVTIRQVAFGSSEGGGTPSSEVGSDIQEIGHQAS